MEKNIRVLTIYDVPTYHFYLLPWLHRHSEPAIVWMNVKKRKRYNNKMIIVIWYLIIHWVFMNFHKSIVMEYRGWLMPYHHHIASVNQKRIRWSEFPTTTSWVWGNWWDAICECNDDLKLIISFFYITSRLWTW